MEDLPVIFGVVFPQPTRQRNSAGPAAAPPNSWYVGAGSGVGATPARSFLAGVWEPNVFRGRAGSRRSAIL